MTQSLNVELIKALGAAQSEFPEMPKDSTGSDGSRQYRYTTLAMIRSIVAPILKKNGLMYTHTLSILESGVTVHVTMLAHTGSGGFISSSCPIDTDLDPKKFGSLQTYYRRYQLSGILGIVSEDDDDGTAAQHKARSTQQVNTTNAGQGKWAPSEAQTKRLYTLAGKVGLSTGDVKELIKNKLGIESTSSLTRPQYDDFCNAMIARSEKSAPSTFNDEELSTQPWPPKN